MFRSVCAQTKLELPIVIGPVRAQTAVDLAGEERGERREEEWHLSENQETVTWPHQVGNQKHLSELGASSP